MKRTISLALLLAMLICSSCGDNPTSVETTENSSEAVSESTTAPDEYVKPDVKFDKSEINCLLWSLNKFVAEEETGDVINDAVYRRNSKVEDLFGVTFKFDVRPGAPGDYANWIGTLNSSILAGDDAYQLAGGYGYRFTGDSLAGNYQNLKNNQYIDFTKPWWSSNIIEAADLGGNMTVAFGNLDPSYYDTTYAIYFNKKLAEDNQLGNIYGLVNDGKWTIDKLIELSKKGARDLNGDTTIGDDDQYGYMGDAYMCVDAFVESCAIQLTKKDSQGIPELVGLTERYTDLQQKLLDFFYSSDSARYKSDSSQNTSIFMSGRSQFMSDSLGIVHTLREMDEDFGIIPFPKYDEAQDKYYTYNAIGNSTAFIVPVTADETLAGCVLEALAYYGWKDVLPEYYERALKGKGARDDDSAAMLDIIFDNIHYDFTEIYAYNFGDQKSPAMALRMSVLNNQSLATLWASDQNLYDATMKELISTLKK